jgi:hypothetical protein
MSEQFKLELSDGLEDPNAPVTVVAITLVHELPNGDGARRAASLIVPGGGGFDAEIDRVERYVAAMGIRLMQNTRERGWKIPTEMPEGVEKLDPFELPDDDADTHST